MTAVWWQMSEFPKDFRLNRPATAEAITSVADELGVPIPTGYCDFLLTASGGEGPIGAESFLILWPVAELVERNRGYRVDPEYARDLLLIGTDGGNEVLAIRVGDGHYVSGPLIGMSPDSIEPKGATLQAFLASFP